MSTNTSPLASGHGHQISEAENLHHTQRAQERQGKEIRPESSAPIYLEKSRNMPQIANPAGPGDVLAHEYDDSRLLKKLMPHDQEHRGCKSRDVDLRIKRDNKALSTGACRHRESEDNIDDETLE